MQMGHQLLHIDAEEMGGQRGRILKKRWEVGLCLAVIEIEITISRVKNFNTVRGAKCGRCS